MSYLELSIEERASIQVGQAQGMSLWYIPESVRPAPGSTSSPLTCMTSLRLEARKQSEPVIDQIARQTSAF